MFIPLYMLPALTSSLSFADIWWFINFVFDLMHAGCFNPDNITSITKTNLKTNQTV